MRRLGILLLPLLIQLAGCAGVVLGGTAAGVSVIHDRRTPGTVIDDELVELLVYDALYQDKRLLEQSHVNVTGYNNQVLLTGEVATPAQRQQVEMIAKGMDKVKNVYNELVIAPPSTVANRNADTWISTKVKSALFGINTLPGFDPTRVKVVTERGTVYLLGLVTAQEAETVTATVRQVNGVQQIVRLFEYL